MDPLTVAGTATTGVPVPAEVLLHLESDPVVNNVLLTHIADPDARCWWVSGDQHDQGPGGVAVQSGPRFPLLLSAMPETRAADLAQRVFDDDASLSAVTGGPAAAQRFAASWAELTGRPARPDGAQRLHVLQPALASRAPVAASEPPALRPAAAGDRAILAEWAAGLIADTHATGRQPAEWLDRHLRRGTLHVLERDGRIVGMAAATPAGRGTVRISSVYTPPAERGRGVAGACVGALAARAFASGALRCVLYTDLYNPGPLAIYRRLGFTYRADTATFSLGG